MAVTPPLDYLVWVKDFPSRSWTDLTFRVVARFFCTADKNSDDITTAGEKALVSLYAGWVHDRLNTLCYHRFCGVVMRHDCSSAVIASKCTSGQVLQPPRLTPYCYWCYYHHHDVCICVYVNASRLIYSALANIWACVLVYMSISTILFSYREKWM